MLITYISFWLAHHLQGVLTCLLDVRNISERLTALLESLEGGDGRVMEGGDRVSMMTMEMQSQRLLDDYQS